MDWSRVLIYFGIFLVLAGAVINLFPWSIAWFGKLPGDIRIQNDRTSVFIPLTSMLLLSVVASIGISLLHRIFPPQ